MIDLNEKILKNYEKLTKKDYIYEKRNNQYEPIKYGKFMEDVWKISNFLIKDNGKNKKYLIFGPNSINIMKFDAAITLYVGISVIVPNMWKKEEIIECINTIDVEYIIFDECKNNIINEMKNEIDCSKIKIINMNKFNNLTEKIEENIKIQDVDKCSKIVFSSGTTGKSKGIMLSIKNIFAGLNSLIKRCPLTEEDSTYLFLPLNHTYAEVYNFMYSIAIGYKVYLASSSKNIGKELLETNPTIFCAVPLIYEKLYEAYQDKIRYAFGKNIKALFCGGAPMDKKIRKTYQESGLNLMQAYALSETASSFAISYPYPKDLESSGDIFEDMQVKIDKPDKNGIGEICAKGESIFLGYINNEQATKEVFDKDGYFHSGDIGYIENGKLFVKGRKKKILLTKTGESIDANELEQKVKNIDNNITNVKAFIKDDLINYNIYINAERNEKEVEKIINEYNKDLPKYLQIINYNIIIDSVDVRLKQ